MFSNRSLVAIKSWVPAQIPEQRLQLLGELAAFPGQNRDLAEVGGAVGGPSKLIELDPRLLLDGLQHQQPLPR